VILGVSWEARTDPPARTCPRSWTISVLTSICAAWPLPLLTEMGVRVGHWPLGAMRPVSGRAMISTSPEAGLLKRSRALLTVTMKGVPAIWLVPVVNVKAVIASL